MLYLELHLFSFIYLDGISGQTTTTCQQNVRVMKLKIREGQELDTEELLSKCKATLMFLSWKQS